MLEVYESAVTALIDTDAALERVASGFQFIEGPVWHVERATLYFSDIPANRQYQYSAAQGARPFRQPSNFSNGLTLDAHGRLFACEHQARRVSRIDADGSETVVDRYQGKRLNSPNDLIFAADGSLLFTDPPYGLLEGLGGPAEAELPFRGVYRLAPGSSEPTLLIDDFAAPNGLALSADQRTLFVDDTVVGHLRRFTVMPDWTVRGGEVLVEFPAEDLGVPDGMKLDLDGNIYCTGPGGVWICTPNGLMLGRIRVPEIAANLAWGDADGRTLYITATSGLYRLRTRRGGRLAWQGETR